MLWKVDSWSTKRFYLEATALTDSGTSGSWDITVLALLEVTGTLGMLDLLKLINTLAVCLLNA